MKLIEGAKSDKVYWGYSKTMIGFWYSSQLITAEDWPEREKRLVETELLWENMPCGQLKILPNVVNDIFFCHPSF